MFSITPSHIIQYLYCPRFTYFEWVLGIPQNEEKFGKVLRGRHVHDQRLERNKGYLRKRLGAIDRYDDQYLAQADLRGRVDEVLVLADGSLAPLDYKFARYEDRVYSTYRTQLYCYALLIERHFDRPVHRGYLVYVRSNHKVIEIPIPVDERDRIERATSKIREIIEQNRFPKATPDKRKCLICTYRNVCIR